MKNYKYELRIINHAKNSFDKKYEITELDFLNYLNSSFCEYKGLEKINDQLYNYREIYEIVNLFDTYIITKNN